ncbi:MAG: hypothetical protein ILP02_04665, partial [Clostridia bacterium]|nr:hypothetical protein [Clostridia bacterium]
VMEAIENIGSETGWHPKLCFCSMIFFGKELASTDLEPIIDHLIRLDKVENSAIVAMSETKASDLLFAKTPLDSISSFALQKIVLKNEWMVSTVGVTNLKQFAEMNYSKSKSAYMPVISIVHDKTKGKDQQSATGEGSDGGSGDKSGGAGGEEVIFDAASIGLFREGRYVGRLSKEETSCYYLFRGPVYDSFITVDVDGEPQLINVEDNAYSVTVNAKDKTIVLKLSLSVGQEDAKTGADLTKLNRQSVVGERVLRDIEDRITEVSRGFTQKLALSGADIFMTKDWLYKYKNSDYERVKDLPLSEFEVIVDVTVRSVD